MSDGGYHAVLSPSGASRWLSCPASVSMSTGAPDTGSAYADEGTRAHAYAAALLTGQPGAPDNDEMAEAVGRYVADVRAFAEGRELRVETAVPIGWLTGEEDATGTSDALILAGDELICIDLKYGRGVRVDAAGNPQLRIYALGALEQLTLTHEFKRVRVMVHQPRLHHVSEEVLTVDELVDWGERVVRPAAQHASRLLRPDAEVDLSDFGPSESACRFCPAKGTCQPLAQYVTAQVLDDFADLAQPLAPRVKSAQDRSMDNAALANCLGAVGLIEDWCKAIRAQADSELRASRPVPGFKLVQGRMGPRQWKNADEAEIALKSMRLKNEQMYDFKLISPTAAEKLKKTGALGPRQWAKVEALVTRNEGALSVAPDSDPRPPVSVTAADDEFADESGATQSHAEPAHDLV